MFYPSTSPNQRFASAKLQLASAGNMFSALSGLGFRSLRGVSSGGGESVGGWRSVKEKTLRKPYFFS